MSVNDPPLNATRPIRNGWEPSGFDGRDYPWPHGGESSTDEVRLDPPFPARDQGEVACCVSASVVGAMELLDAQHGGVAPLSPLYNYWRARRSHAHLGDISIRNGLKAAARWGVSEHEMHRPQGEGLQSRCERAHALTAPSAGANSSAREHRIVEEDPDLLRTRYYTLPAWGTSSAWISALRHGYPIIAGFYCTSSYWELEEGDAVVTDVSQNVGARGHAVLVVGYSDEFFEIRDSRGEEWGIEGHWWLEASIVDTPWVAESWAVEAIDYDA